MRKGQVDLNPNVPMEKNDSKAVGYYGKNVPSYRWPKKMMENKKADRNIADLFF